MLLDRVGDDCVLLIDARSGRVVTAGQIRARAAEIKQTERGLAFLMADGSLESSEWFLGLFEARHPVALLDPGTPVSLVLELISQYRPDVIIDPSGNILNLLMSPRLKEIGRLRNRKIWYANTKGLVPHKDLAVMLTTSGSTGSPKFVRLSVANILSNAQQIITSLGIRADDRAVTTLPLFYSFGMSVFTSHVLAGASVVVTTVSMLEERFWSDMVKYCVSFLPGVPATYSMLKRLGFEQRRLPSLRALTQAGGRLTPDLVSFFHEVMASRNGELFVMYGQTEASPRMACLPSDSLPEKIGSAGLALPGGQFTIRGLEGEILAPGEIGEIFYRGPNVMMGYAESREHLALGSTNGEELSTGDLGYLDDHGFLFLTGRSKRICKLAGTRVSLDEIEGMISGILPGDAQIAAVDSGEAGVAIFVSEVDAAARIILRREIANNLRVPPKLLSIILVDRIPLLASGKTDYASLAQSLTPGTEVV